MDQPEPASAPDPESELHPDDAAWLQRKSTVAPLALGVIGLALSPLLLGLILGPLGMRAGIDLWRSGARSATVMVGVAASFCAVILSVIAALVWGSVVSTVLLGRDAMKVTEGWRGERIEPATAPFVPADGAERILVVIASGGNEPCRLALTHAAEALAKHPSCRLVLIDAGDAAGLLEREARAARLDAPVITALSAAPSPLSGAIAFPTTVVIDRAGRVESAVVGARPAAEIEKMLSGAYAIGDGQTPTVKP